MHCTPFGRCLCVVSLRKPLSCHRASLHYGVQSCGHKFVGGGAGRGGAGRGEQGGGSREGGAGGEQGGGSREGGSREGERERLACNGLPSH